MSVISAAVNFCLFFRILLYRVISYCVYIHSNFIVIIFVTIIIVVVIHLNTDSVFILRSEEAILQLLSRAVKGVRQYHTKGSSVALNISAVVKSLALGL